MEMTYLRAFIFPITKTERKIFYVMYDPKTRQSNTDKVVNACNLIFFKTEFCKINNSTVISCLSNEALANFSLNAYMLVVLVVCDEDYHW